jgi:hypothetical protein
MKSDLSDTLTLELWQNVVDQLNLGEMPPEKKPQPPSAERERVINEMTAVLKLAYAEKRSTGQQAVIRRLNKFELRNTLRDLFHLQHPDFHPTVVSGLYDFNGNGITAQKTIEPTRTFPDDEEEHGLDTIGGKLVMSDFLLKMILGAAEESIELATHNEKPPEYVNKTWTSPIVKHPNRLGGGSISRWQRDLDEGFDAIFQRWDRYERISPDELDRGIGKPGMYRITIEMSGHNQRHEWNDWMMKTNQDEPFLMGLYLERKEHLRGPRIELQAHWKLPGDGKRRTFTADCWIEKTWTPWVGWENGPHIKHNVHGQLVQRYYKDEYFTQKERQIERDDWQREMAEILLLDEGGYKGPNVRVHSFKVEPIPQPWPPKSHTALYGEGKLEDADLKSLFLRFAERAWRRSVAADEIDDYVALVSKLQSDGDSLQDAVKAAYSAILCSPDFIYIQQRAEALDDNELAERLSYFLWSSMPDAELLAAARGGKLSDNTALGRQVERMLQDPKAAAFTRHFPERWLHLHDLGKMAPDKKGPFGAYFRLNDDMVGQIDAYFAELLDRNGPIRNLIDSDYVFTNQLFADTYYPEQKDHVMGKYLRKVAIRDPRMGGIFTSPAVMTVTANGVDTNPIVRGVYMLENVLGTPPNPPPPDVEPLSPDLRAAKTLKEQLQLHRDQEACNSCHRKIDPMGFAFENFDPIGRWRTHYPKTDKKQKGPGEAIDVTATLSDGREVKDIIAFKQMLLEREDLVVRCLTEKMLSYGSGRLMEPGDRGEVDRIAAELKEKGNGLRDLVHLVVRSDIFRNK